ncbi:zinc phosphodiesterase ELAC protein 2-like isoform X1 [Acropora muricata]|uniref:zinc phosphodiesterase ELAC protein 2-like isoform X1 n=1 Tax=Acropora muricata TaxID=159855 RepID=UPI0034E3CE6D
MRAFFALARIPKKRLLNLMAASFSTKPSARVYLQVLGTETKDTSPSLFLFADSQRYLFNCGEGTQRIFNEHKLKLTKINNIFLTRLCWEYIGGLPGMAMTLRDNGKSDIRLNGPSNLSDFIRATRFFLHHESLKFDCTGYNGGDDESYEDENLRIEPVIINGKKQDAGFEASSSNDHTAPQDQFASPNDVDNDLPSSKKLKPRCESSSSVCYICWLSALPGKFFVKKALELGVPKGPLFGELQAGNTITLDNGQQIKPEQVMGPSQPGPVFLIIDCPSTDFISSLVSNEHLSRHFEDGSCPTAVIIIHLTPMSVFESHEYVEWRNRFGDKVSHLLINKDVCATPLVFQSQATVQCKLHSLDAEMFPLLESSDVPMVKQCDLPKNCYPGENFLQFHLRPIKQQGFDRSDIPNALDRNSILLETKTLLEEKPLATGVCVDENTHDRLERKSFGSVRSLSTSTSAVSKDLIRKPEPPPILKNLPFEEAGVTLTCEERNGASPEFMVNKAQESQLNLNNYEVVFLGTGAALPSKYRNVSSTLIHMSDTASMLFDCGEGTYGQLYRHYGEYFSNRVLLRLKAVFISHIHADHHLGLIRILQKREILLPDERLLIIGPENIGKWLHEYDTMCEDISYRFVDSSDLVVHRDGDYWNVYGHLQAQEILTVPVDHCTEAYGLVLKHQHGWKIVYSGDTRPCPELIEAGKDADLLIHEATLEDELKSEALSKMHSTTTEAIESGVRMEAKFIMLNHFSQRYPKIPMFSERFTKYTGIAFDHMRVHPRNFSRIPQLLEPLKTLFSEEIDEMVKK